MKFSIHKVHEILSEVVPTWQTPIAELVEVQTNNPFKVLVATVLSAQTKDTTTAVVVKKLFSQIKTIKQLEIINEEELQQLIYPVSYYKTKAKHLKLLAKKLRVDFSNKVPESIEELVTLPGVGRKTANVTLAAAFKKPAIGVDTHVHRISNRFGYVNTRTRHETEMALREKLPRKYWVSYNLYLVSLGQNVCKPISPLCSQCPIKKYCERVGVVKSR